MEPETLPPPPDPPAAPANDIRPDPAAKAPARITVIDVLYFQPAGRGIEAQPVGVEARFSRDLKSDEQLYERRAKAGPDWKALELGWIDPADCGMLVLRNLEGTDLATIPTADEKTRTGRLEIEVMATVHPSEAVGVVFAKVRPGESMRLEPVGLKGYRLACPAGTARFALTLIPG